MSKQKTYPNLPENCGHDKHEFFIHNDKITFENGEPPAYCFQFKLKCADCGSDFEFLGIPFEPQRSFFNPTVDETFQTANFPLRVVAPKKTIVPNMTVA